VLVNNAAVLHLGAVEDTSVADFERVMGVNQLGTFLGIRSAIEPMKRAGRGSIVNISSVDGFSAKNGVIAYAATKWAVRGMTRVAALELGRFGIRVNAVCPEAGSGDMIRPYVPEGIDIELAVKGGQPNLATQKDRSIGERIGDVANMVLFLASDASASCTGADFIVDGGNTAGKVLRGVPGS
jgi:3alpha(or 20beta)-hydroxysteroid dehydrogenase